MVTWKVRAVTVGAQLEEDLTEVFNTLEAEGFAVVRALPIGDTKILVLGCTPNTEEEEEEVVLATPDAPAPVRIESKLSADLLTHVMQVCRAGLGTGSGTALSAAVLPRLTGKTVAELQCVAEDMRRIHSSMDTESEFKAATQHIEVIVGKLIKSLVQ